MDKDNLNKSSDTLTAKQRAFVREYGVDYNATQAAIRAGYSKKTADQIGKENLRKPPIATALEAREAKLTTTSETRRAWILEKLEELAYYGSKRDRTGRFKDGPTAKGALELLGKYETMFTDKIQGDMTNRSVEDSKGSVDFTAIQARRARRSGEQEATKFTKH